MGLASVLTRLYGGSAPKTGLESFQDFDVLAEADALLSTTEIKAPPKEGQTFRASGLSKMCPREEVLCFLHDIKRTVKIDSRLQRTFDIGESFHSLVQNKWFGKWGWLIGDWSCANRRCPNVWKNQKKPQACSCGSQEFFYDELTFGPTQGITAHLDGIVEKNGFRKVVELKTCNSKVFKFLTEVRGDALEQHKDQINTYMWISGVKVGTIIYLDKDESNWKQFPQHFDQARMDALLGKIRAAHEGMKTKTPPRGICEKKDCARAKSCSVRDLCFS